MLLPALQGAKEKAKHARWLGYKNNLRCEPSLVAYYTFEEGKSSKLKNKAVGDPMNAKYAPEKMDGTISGATWVKNGGRWTGKNTLEFDGSNDYVDCGNAASLNITDAITIEVWVKRNSKNNFERFLSHSIDSSNYAYEVGVDFANPDKWRLRLNSDGATLLATMVGDAGEWMHVVYSYDKSLVSDNMKIYKNGVLLTSGNYTASLTNHGTLRTNRAGKNDGWLNGTIGEVAIYNRALSANKIKGHYEMGRP